MIFFGVLLVLGLRTRQRRRYWYHAAVAVAIQVMVGFMFAAPRASDATGDGLGTVSSRLTATGPPLSGLAGLVSLALGWGVPIWLTARGYERKATGVPV